jgi:hypothetical protein
MSRRLKQKSRSVLEYRPSIAFVEPEVVSVDPQPQDYSEIQSEEDGITKLKYTQQLAKNAAVLGQKVQEEVDRLSKGFEVALNSQVDSNCIRALQRHYPGTNPMKVTYEQYRQCKDHQKALMEDVPDKLLNPLKASEIEKAKKALDEGNISDFLGVVGRTDTDPSSQVIPPVDIDAVQDTALRALANMLWKNFVKPVIPLPPGVSFLPDEIAPMPDGPSPDEMVGQAHQKSGGAS